MYRGLLARMGKSKKEVKLEKSSSSATSSSSTSEPKGGKEDEDDLGSGPPCKKVAEKNPDSPFEGGMKPSAGKVTIDFGKFDPEWKIKASGGENLQSSKSFYGFPNSKVYGKRRTAAPPNLETTKSEEDETEEENSLSRPPKRGSSDCKTRKVESSPERPKEENDSPPTAPSLPPPPPPSSSSTQQPSEKKGLEEEESPVIKPPEITEFVDTSIPPPNLTIVPKSARGRGNFRGRSFRYKFENSRSYNNQQGFEPSFPMSVDSVPGFPPVYTKPPPNIPKFEELVQTGFVIPPPSIGPCKEELHGTENSVPSRVYACASEEKPFSVTPIQNKFRKDCTSSYELVQNFVTSLWNVPYEKQLKLKEDEVLAFMSKLKVETLNANKALHSWYAFQEQKFPSICKLSPMAPCPITEGYRNMCDFVIGFNKDVNKLTIGFLVEYDSYYVGPIDHLKHVPQQIKVVASALEKYLVSSSYSPYNPKFQSGNWMNCVVRTTVNKATMLIVSFHPQDLEKLQIKDEKQKLRDYFESDNESSSKVTSLYFNQRTLEDNGTYELLYGEEFLSETLMGNLFRITPRIPFSLNTTANEMLLKILGDASNINSSSTLMDMCCGGGTVGLSLSPLVGQVIGLDIVEEFVNDARMNALKNNLTNCEFFTGSAEEYLPTLLNRSNFSNLVLVIDPPKTPLDSKVISNIRQCPKIDRVIILISNPRSVVKNVEDLVRAPSNTFKGDPFIPVEAIPVDTSPHTFQFTMILILMRVCMRDLANPHDVNFDKFYGHATNFTTKTTTANAPKPSLSQTPSDIAWKRDEKPALSTTGGEEKGLTQEQLVWLNKMSDMYKTEFDRSAWVDNLKQQNREASMKQCQNPSPQRTLPHAPPASHTQQPPTPTQQPSIPAQQPAPPIQQPPPPMQQPPPPIQQPPPPIQQPPPPIQQPPPPIQQPPPPIQQQPRFQRPPPAPTHLPPSISSVSNLHSTSTPDYWSQYNKQYSGYMVGYQQPGPSPIVTAPAQTPVASQASCDPVAWKQYCEQMASYWAQWAHSSYSGGSNPATCSTSTPNFKPPLPPNPPPLQPATSESVSSGQPSGYLAK